ncbi:MAG TPA: twin-arginine translocase TatA/TatE family subunit [Candidatus Saccharimonadales bacterium]|nr:twin-arginine translocase TatA/TatE family subunit [Candidatus Saccharimonadales bacterium]
MFGLGQAELLIILFIVLLFFGPSKLPKLSKTFGESVKSLRDGFTDGKNDKSLKDITREVSSSARDIKQSIAEVKRAPFAANEQGYGQEGYGGEKNGES